MDGGAVWPIALHSGTVNTCHFENRFNQIRLTLTSIGFYHVQSWSWRTSLTFLMGFFIYFLNDIPKSQTPSARSLPFLKKSHGKSGGRLGDWWFIEKLGRNPRSKPIPGHLAERSTDPSWQGFNSQMLSTWPMWSIPLEWSSMSWFAMFASLQERSEYKRYWVHWLLKWSAMKCLVSLCKTLVWITIDPFWSSLLV